MTPAFRYHVETVDGKKTRHKIVRHHGFEGYWVRYTEDCSGCTEYGDYGTRYGPFGCEECGYTGKRRVKWFVPLDEDAWNRWQSRIWERYERMRARLS